MHFDLPQQLTMCSLIKDGKLNATHIEHLTQSKVGDPSHLDLNPDRLARQMLTKLIVAGATVWRLNLAALTCSIPSPSLLVSRIGGGPVERKYQPGRPLVSARPLEAHQ